MENKKEEVEEEEITSKDKNCYVKETDDEVNEVETGNLRITIKEDQDVRKFYNVRDIFDSDSD